MKLIDLLDEYNVPYDTSGKDTRDGWAQLTCPQCGGDRYLGLNTNRNYFNCWRCGWLKPGEVLAALTGLSVAQGNVLVGKASQGHDEPTKPHSGRLVLPKGLEPLLTPHRSYLRGRGFNPDELVRLWQLQCTGFTTKLPWRIFIPLTHHSKVVSWTMRKIVDEGQRYHSAPREHEAIDSSGLLFGEDYCRHGIIVHEGPTDVFATGPGAVCTFGLGRISPAQVLRISRYPVRVVCLDNEPGAQQRARDLCNQLEVYPGKTINAVLDAKDAGASNDKELHQLRNLIR